jgi:hypothetical protein
VTDLQSQAMVSFLQLRELHQLHLAALIQRLDPGAEFKDSTN